MISKEEFWDEFDALSKRAEQILNKLEADVTEAYKLRKIDRNDYSRWMKRINDRRMQYQAEFVHKA